MKILRARSDRPPRGGRRVIRRGSSRVTVGTLSVMAIATAGLGLLWLSSASSARPPLAAPLHEGIASSSTPAAPSTTPDAPAGDPTATIAAPVDGSTVAAGSAVALTARGSADLVTALQAGTPRSCWFTVGDNASTSVAGTLTPTTATCSASWTAPYKAAFTITGWFATASTVAYPTTPVTLNVTGADSPRCVSAASPACSFKWVEVAYTSSTAYSGRVCGIDTCAWTSTHTAWTQVSDSSGAKDYWLNRTGSMATGDVAEAYLCLGSSSADWSTYSSGRNFVSLLGQPETSANPLAAGTCTS